uniref:Uncharacterized protein n=1 Tax=viral metagenome TaxID=1070528 RepID=A0A6M3KTE1_9ZZZZ
MAEKSREWRPGNWENPHNMAHAIYPNSTLLLLPDGRQVEGGYANSIGLESYEEGADAMFAAMKQAGYLSPTEVEAKLSELRGEVLVCRKALEDDASDLWKVTNAIKKEIESREWIMEGRGSYAWDDDRYRDETRLAFEVVLELIKGVQHPAQLRFHGVEAKLKAEREQREAKPNTGDYRKAEGVLPLTPGSELPEETIRRMRDGLPSRVTDNELRANLKHLLMSETPLTPWNKADYIIDRIIALIDEHHKAHPYQRMPSGRREVNMNKTCSMCGHEATKGETFTIFFNPASEWAAMFGLPQYCDQCLPKIQAMRLRAKLKNEEQASGG